MSIPQIGQPNAWYRQAPSYRNCSGLAWDDFAHRDRNMHQTYGMTEMRCCWQRKLKEWCAASSAPIPTVVIWEGDFPNEDNWMEITSYAADGTVSGHIRVTGDQYRGNSAAIAQTRTTVQYALHGPGPNAVPYRIHMREGKTELVLGVPVTLKNLPGLPADIAFFAHTAEDGRVTVSETATGYAIATGASLKSAAASAAQFIRDCGAAEFLRRRAAALAAAAQTEASEREAVPA